MKRPVWSWKSLFCIACDAPTQVVTVLPGAAAEICLSTSYIPDTHLLYLARMRALVEAKQAVTTHQIAGLPVGGKRVSHSSPSAHYSLLSGGSVAADSFDKKIQTSLVNVHDVQQRLLTNCRCFK